MIWHISVGGKVLHTFEASEEDCLAIAKTWCEANGVEWNDDVWVTT